MPQNNTQNTNEELLEIYRRCDVSNNRTENPMGENEFIQAIERLIVEGKIEEVREIPDYGLEVPTDYACNELSHSFNKCVNCHKQRRIAYLQASLKGNKE